jgi:hypothetical protein
MSDKEEVFEKPVQEKKPRKKRVMTEEQKEKLREQLKKGRETAMKNRQKKALGRKIDKEKKEKELDEKIATNILGKNKHEDDIEDLKNQIKELRDKQGNSDEVKQLRAELKQLKDGINQEIEKAKSRFKVTTQEPTERVASLEKKSNVKLDIVENSAEDARNVETEKPREEKPVEAPPPVIKPRKVFSTRKGFSNTGF